MRKDKETYYYDTVFAQRLRAAMRLRDVDTEELADSVYICKNTMLKYRTGRIAPKVEMIVSICRVLDISADYLLGLTDEKRELK